MNKVGVDKMTTVLLLIIGILLVAINIKAVEKEKNSFKDAFNNASTNVKNYDLEIGKLRKEFAESLFEFQKEIEELKDKLEKSTNVNNNNINNSNIENNILNNNELDSVRIYSEKNIVEETNNIDKDGKINENKHIDNNEMNNTKIDDIEKLMKEGLSVDIISKKLGIGKGEILLIQKLYIK